MHELNFKVNFRRETKEGRERNERDAAGQN